MEPIKKIGSYSLFSATTIGFMANNILPARVGEVIKAFVLGKKEKTSVSASFATIILERLLDLSVVFYIYVLSSLRHQSSPYKLYVFNSFEARRINAIVIFFFQSLCFFFILKTIRSFSRKLPIAS